ncbi:hypothetical protein H8E06_00135 [bacterium]|nr:hypothetical protein [bacterium]
MAVKIPDFKIRENLVVKGTTTLQQTLATSGDSTFGSDVAISGNLHTLGDATIDGSLTVKGEMTFVESSSIRLEDPLITLGHGNSATDVNDIGWYSTYYDSGVKYTGLFRDATDGVYKLFKGLATDPVLSAIDTTDVSIELATLSAIVPGTLIEDGSIENVKLANSSLIVNNNPVSLGGSVDIPVHAHADSCSIDLEVSQTMVSGAMTDTLSANVRYADSTIDCLPNGIRVVPGSLSATHLSDDTVQTYHISAGVVTTDKIADEAVNGAKIASEQITSAHISPGSITNDSLSTSSLTINNNVVELGSNVTVPVHAHADSCSIDLEVGQTEVNGVMTDTLSANVRYADSTIDCLPNGIRVVPGSLNNSHLSGGTFSVNGVATPIGGNLNVSINGSATIDTSTLDFDDAAYPGQIVADVRLAGNSLTAIDEPGLSGLAVATAGINGTHIAEDGSLTDGHLSGGTFSVNGVSGNIGGNVSISIHGTASATDSITLSTVNDILYGNVRLSDDTLSIDTDGLKITSPTFSVNGLSANLGDAITMPLVTGLCNSPSIIHYVQDQETDYLCADIRLSDTSLQVLSTGLSGLRIAPAGVSATHISIDTVQTDHISAGVITTDKIADGSITSAKIADGTVIAADVADGSITSAKIDSNAITTSKIASQAITTAKVAASAVTAGKIAGDAVTTDKIVDQAITTAKISPSAVTTDRIADDTVTADKLVTGSVTTAKISPSAVTTDRIADGSVTTDKINDAAVTNAKLATPTFSVNNVSANIGENISITLYGAASATDTMTLSVTDTDILFGDVNVGSIGTTYLGDGAVTSAKIAGDAVTSAKIADDAVGNEHLQDNAVATNSISAGAVTNDKLDKPTFSVNGIIGQLGDNVVVSTQNDPMYLNHSVMATMSASVGTTATTFDTYPLSGCDTFSYIIQVQHPDTAQAHKQLSNLMVI